MSPVRIFALRPAAVVLPALLAAAMLLAPSELSASVKPRIDATFGGGHGFVTTSIAGTDAVAYGAIEVPGGSTVVAGQASPPTGIGQVLVARYGLSGRLDSRFASRGIFRSKLPDADGPFLATVIAPEPRTGKLIVAGGYGQGSILVMRLTVDGRLDPTFGAKRSGFASIVSGGIANSLVIARDGGILVGGSNANRPGRPFVVARFTHDGAVDRSFGRRGLAQALFWNPTSASGAGINLAATPDGGVIAAGHVDYIGGSGGGSGGHGSAGVMRFSRTGHLMPSFGTRGVRQITFYNRARSPESWYPCAMTRDQRGRITVTGGGGTHRSALFTARLTASGALDRSYGPTGDGRSATPGVGGNAITTCGITPTSTGGITVGVENELAQLLPNGRPNQAFAPGRVFSIAAPAQVFLNAVLTSGQRRLVAVGSAGDAIYVGRYLLPAGRGR